MFGELTATNRDCRLRIEAGTRIDRSWLQALDRDFLAQSVDWQAA